MTHTPANEPGFAHLKAHERKVHRSIGMLADTSSTSRLTASFEYMGPALGGRKSGEATS